jgi:hypothetical protein
VATASTVFLLLIIDEQLGKLRCRCGDEIKMDLGEIG